MSAENVTRCEVAMNPMNEVISNLKPQTTHLIEIYTDGDEQKERLLPYVTDMAFETTAQDTNFYCTTKQVAYKTAENGTVSMLPDADKEGQVKVIDRRWMVIGVSSNEKCGVNFHMREMAPMPLIRGEA